MLIIPQVEELRNLYDPHLYESFKRTITYVNSLSAKLNVDGSKTGLQEKPESPLFLSVSGANGFFNVEIVPHPSYRDPIFYFFQTADDAIFETNLETFWIGTRPKTFIKVGGVSKFCRAFAQYFASDPSDPVLADNNPVDSGVDGGIPRLVDGFRQYFAYSDRSITPYANFVTMSGSGAAAIQSPDATDILSVKRGPVSGVNADCGDFIDNLMWRVGDKLTFAFYHRFAQIATTSARLWLGVHDSTKATIMAADTHPTVKYAMFHYNPFDGADSDIRCKTGDGTTQFVTQLSGVTLDTNWHLWQIEWDDTTNQVTFKLDGVTRAVHSSNVPAVGTLLGAIAVIRARANGTKFVETRLGWWEHYSNNTR